MVGNDFAIEIDANSYSVPCRLFQPPAGDGLPVGSASLQAASAIFNRHREPQRRGGSLFMTEKGVVPNVFDTLLSLVVFSPPLPTKAHGRIGDPLPCVRL